MGIIRSVDRCVSRRLARIAAQDDFSSNSTVQPLGFAVIFLVSLSLFAFHVAVRLPIESIWGPECHLIAVVLFRPPDYLLWG